MYVCICNGINDRQVKEAVAAGAKKWTDVHEHHGCKPECGGCGVEISEFISKSKRNDSPPVLIPIGLVEA